MSLPNIQKFYCMNSRFGKDRSRCDKVYKVKNMERFVILRIKQIFSRFNEFKI